jgi:hypothetical protein
MENRIFDKKIGIRDSFFLADKYRLDLSWSSIIYKEGECYLKDAIFSGPALQFAEQIMPDNNIDLDFCKQYYVITAGIYIGKLSWGKVEYLDGAKVKLYNCKLTHDEYLNIAPTLKNDDKLVIDTSGHDAEIHHLNTTYKAFVVNKDWQVYNFTRGT